MKLLCSQTISYCTDDGHHKTERHQLQLLAARKDDQVLQVMRAQQSSFHQISNSTANHSSSLIAHSAFFSAAQIAHSNTDHQHPRIPRQHPFWNTDIHHKPQHYQVIAVEYNYPKSQQFPLIILKIIIVIAVINKMKFY